MSEASSVNLSLNIYEETLNEETICDCSSQGLEVVPIVQNKLLSVLYLQNNKLKALPEDFFFSLPSLMYLDLRDNVLTNIPKTIQDHQTLTHLLLQNNKLTTLPIELGSVATLKVLQLNGNPLTFPPKDVIDAGFAKMKNFLREKFVESNIFRVHSAFSEDRSNFDENTSFSHDVVSYNSVIDEEKIRNNVIVKFNEKESSYSDDEYYGKMKGKCPKLAKSRHKTLPTYYQSAKYVKPVYADDKQVQNEKIKHAYLKDLAIKKHKALLATRENILQERMYRKRTFDFDDVDDAKFQKLHHQFHSKSFADEYRNLQLLQRWRSEYRAKKATVDRFFKLNNFPYDTNPDYMTVLSREDIEKDLPDKYRKKLMKKCKPTVPRKSNNDVHLALKIKQLFENLEAIDLNKGDMTPRTEQKVLMNEIHKISVIKEKLKELSTTNTRSVTDTA